MPRTKVTKKKEENQKIARIIEALQPREQASDQNKRNQHRGDDGDVTKNSNQQMSGEGAEYSPSARS